MAKSFTRIPRRRAFTLIETLIGLMLVIGAAAFGMASVAAMQGGMSDGQVLDSLRTEGDLAQLASAGQLTVDAANGLLVTGLPEGAGYRIGQASTSSNGQHLRATGATGKGQMPMMQGVTKLTVVAVRPGVAHLTLRLTGTRAKQANEFEMVVQDETAR